MKVVKNSAIYAIVTILQKAVGFFLLPVYTTQLSASDYGVVNVVTTLVALFSVLSLFSMHGAGTWFFYECRDSPERVKRLWGTIFTLVLANSLILTTIIILGRELFLFPFAKGISFYPDLFLGMVSVVTSSAYTVFQSDLQARQSGVEYGANNLAYFLLNVPLTIALVVLLKMKATGVLLALAITNATFFAYTLARYVPQIRICLDKEVIKKSLRYSWPLLPHSFAGWVVVSVDRILLNAMKSAESVGVYSIGFQFANVINIMTGAVNQAYAPWFFEKLKEGGDGKRKIAQFSEFLILVYSIAALAMGLFSVEVVRVMVGRDFRSGWVVVPFLSFSFVFGGIYYCVVNTLFADKTKFVPIVTLAGAALSISLNFLLIPHYGIIGSAVSNMLSNIGVSLIALYIANKINYVGFKWPNMFGYAFVCFGLSMASFVCKGMHPFPAFLTKVAVFVPVCLFLFIKYRTQVLALFTRLLPLRNGSSRV